MPEYTVKQGDCVSSLAAKYGLLPETIWDHPSNAALMKTREDPNILFPGDILFIPDKEEKVEAGATTQRHRFRKKGVPEKLRLRLLDNDEPLANLPFQLNIDGKFFEGTTDGDGCLEQSIPPGAKRGKLLVGEGEDQFEYNLILGHLDPLDEISGLQGRLNSLDFDCGKIDGVFGNKTKRALSFFQKKHDLEPTGEIDEATKKVLKEQYQC